VQPRTGRIMYCQAGRLYGRWAASSSRKPVLLRIEDWHEADTA
jgi:hypothetical protein